MTKLLSLVAMGLTVMMLAGCGNPKYLSPGLYDIFQPLDSPIYERASDSVTIHLSPEGRNQPRDLQIQNIRLADNCDVHIQGPLWVNKRAQIQVIVQGVSTMNHSQPIQFDILQNGVVRQTITITVSAPPEIQVKINGQPVSVHQPV